jgi:hypothetical protein
MLAAGTLARAFLQPNQLAEPLNMGRPPGAENKDKPFRAALRIELAARGENMKALRKIAGAVIDKASSGDTQAALAIRDTLDSKPAQEVTGKDGGPIEHEHEITDIDRARALAALIARTKHLVEKS